MDEILHQLGDLLLGSIPTMVLFLLTLLLYRVLVYTPLTRVLAERRERTSGAVAKAHEAIAAADAKSQEYEAKLRAARAEIFRAREAKLQAWNRERDRVLDEARQTAQQRVQTARERIDAEAAEARANIEQTADKLAGEILKAVLPREASLAGSTR